MPGMEEVAGYWSAEFGPSAASSAEWVDVDPVSYDQFFGPNEWQAIVTGDWSQLDYEDEDFEEEYGWS